MNILITGGAGFIGSAIASMLLSSNASSVVVVDNLNEYYPPSLKRSRLKILSESPQFVFHNMDVRESDKLSKILRKESIELVLHFASEVGVRDSVMRPSDYHSTNVDGILSVLESCRNAGVQRLIYASSSSIYGDGGLVHSHLCVKSLYAATKIACESYVQSYVNQYGIDAIGLRLFTVYGSFGRPDMALYRFTDRIANGLPITLYHNGQPKRDFCYIDDVVHAVKTLIERIYAAEGCGHELVDIGPGQPRSVAEMVNLIEKSLHIKAKVLHEPLPEVDAEITCATPGTLQRLLGSRQCTPLESGVADFIKWYRATEAEQSMWRVSPPSTVSES